MANQAIALGVRGPQVPDISRVNQQYGQIMNMMAQQRAAERQAAQAQQAMTIAAAEEGRKKQLFGPQMGKATAEAFTAQQKSVMDFMGLAYEGIEQARGPEDVIKIAGFLKQNFPDEVFGQMVDQTIADMPTDPTLFPNWQQQTKFETLETAKQLENDFTQQNLGTSTRIVSTPKYGRGSATVVPGSEAQVTLKPTGMNVEGLGAGTYDPNTNTFTPAAVGAVGTGGFGGGGGGGGSRGLPAATGGDVFGRMIRVESGGKQFDRSGQPLTSSAGAIGIAQVMPKTAPEAARLAGLPFDDNRYRNDPEYNRALGEAYFEKQLADFGDERLAAAAYNAGPGAVRRALQKGGPDGWINHVPTETQKYIQSVFGGGGRGAAGTAEPRTTTQTASAMEKQRKVKTFQEMSGVDLNTQLNTSDDPVSKLIKGSTSGMIEAVGAEIAGAIPESMGGGATPGMKNIGQLETIATTLTLAFAPDGRLSTGVSNEDRRVIERQLGVIQDPTIPSGKRLAAWGEVKRIMARTIGLTETPRKTPTTGGKKTGKPSLDSFRR